MIEDDVIRCALEELRNRLPIGLNKFYKLFRKRTGCGAAFNPLSDYQYLELGSSASLELFDRHTLIVFCGEQGEEKYEVELRKVLIIDYRKHRGLSHDSYLLYYEVPRI